MLISLSMMFSGSIHVVVYIIPFRQGIPELWGPRACSRRGCLYVKEECSERKIGAEAQGKIECMRMDVALFIEVSK